MKTGNSIPYIAAIQFQEATNLQPIRDSFHHGLKAKKKHTIFKVLFKGAEKSSWNSGGNYNTQNCKLIKTDLIATAWGLY